MKVLQILHTDEIGGIQTLAHMIEQGLVQHGVEVETAIMFPRPFMPAKDKLVAAIAMARRIMAGGCDALIAYQATASILVGTAGRLGGFKNRIVHQTAIPGETAPFVRWLDRFVGTTGGYTANIANSVFTQNEFSHYPVTYRRDLRLIEHGLDAPQSHLTMAEARQRFNLPATGKLILNVGRLVDQKNQDVLVKALPALPAASLVIAGDGPKRTHIEALAREFGVHERLILLGNVSPSDVPDLFAAADVFAFPSVWETFGLAAVEAAMVGLPSVVADLDVLREVLATGEIAPIRFANPHDVKRWKDALAQMLRNPPPPAVRREAARAVTAKYARERMVDSYLDLLQVAH
ncbi:MULTISPECIES: glycosyltransferase family 4 protein [unclassified Chelatococcus]|uniref:glycosyltransferase family 4 protein n=1 Tax=unclassified Chelatococcus TaxID=2638111 RepID=UPI001BCEF721|nr:MULTISPECIES: glycosyltransferase family 4 protein [unclassified Chelatococcus]MBS7697317.1 glycosyltransferase family 4 protein [Chelatococcus sp. YT9]MBX3556386.1 glycosyltransferase family 4 protein [Chelatococcus sp.]